jgi:hypothetical protein
MKRKTSQRGSKRQVSPLEETKDAKTSQGNSESGSKLQIPKLKITRIGELAEKREADEKFYFADRRAYHGRE